MASLAPRLLNVLYWVGMLTFFIDMWELSGPLLSSTFQWLISNPIWIPAASLYLACVTVKSFLWIQSVTLMIEATKRQAGRQPDMARDVGWVVFVCMTIPILQLFIVMPILFHERSRFWHAYPRRQIIASGRRDDWSMRHLVWMRNCGLLR